MWKLVIAACLCIAVSAEGFAAEKQDAFAIYQKLTGIPLQLGDSRLEKIQSLVKSGKTFEAALFITEDPAFLQVTIRDFAAVMSNREGIAYGSMNDFTALVMGITRDDIDARDLLTANYRYEGKTDLNLPPVAVNNNLHFEAMDAKGYKYRDALVRRVPQWDHIPAEQTAGLLTTRAWAEAHYKMGTNRRSLQFAMQELLCRPIVSWKDTSISDDRVRRDVPRAPSSDANEYQSNCRGCHAPMDAMAGAFAHFDFGNNSFTYLSNRVAPKMTQNGYVFPFGYITTDSSWHNYLKDNPSFGWQGNDFGDDPRSLGQLLSHSNAFAECMARRSFRSVCHYDLEDAALVAKLTQSFAESGYKLRYLFADAAVRCQKQ